jgi:hypothetical protein
VEIDNVCIYDAVLNKDHGGTLLIPTIAPFSSRSDKTGRHGIIHVGEIVRQARVILAFVDVNALLYIEQGVEGLS